MRFSSVTVMSLVAAWGHQPLRAQVAAPASAPTTASAAEVLAALREVKLDAPQMLYLEAVAGPATIGYTQCKLSAAKLDGSTGLEYELVSVLVTPDKTRLEGTLRARLTSRFEPLEIESRRNAIPPSGPPRETVERAEIHEAEIVLSRSEGDNPVATRTVPRPPSPFVSAVEFLIQRVDAKRFTSFVIPELNPQLGTLVAHHFHTGPEPAGGYRLASTKDNGQPGYSFQVDAKGALETWREPPTPVLFKVCPADRFEEVKKLFQK